TEPGAGRVARGARGRLHPGSGGAAALRGARLFDGGAAPRARRAVAAGGRSHLPRARLRRHRARQIAAGAVGAGGQPRELRGRADRGRARAVRADRQGRAGRLAVRRRGRALARRGVRAPRRRVVGRARAQGGDARAGERRVGARLPRGHDHARRRSAAVPPRAVRRGAARGRADRPGRHRLRVARRGVDRRGLVPAALPAHRHARAHRRHHHARRAARPRRVRLRRGSRARRALAHRPTSPEAALMSQESAMQYLRHGQTPFFRLPAANFAERGAEAYRGARAVVLGVPWDGGTTYQPGARLGPYHVRRVSALVQSYHPGHRVDVFDRVRAVDGGNVVFPPFDAAAVRARIEEEVGAVLGAGAAPFLVGGDHSIALPALRAISAKHGRVAVVHVDAHADTSGPEVWGDAHHHGTPLRHALEENLIAPGQLYQIGLRGPWGTSEDGLFAAAHGGKVFSKI